MEIHNVIPGMVGIVLLIPVENSDPTVYKAEFYHVRVIGGEVNAEDLAKVKKRALELKASNTPHYGLVAGRDVPFPVTDYDLGRLKIDAKRRQRML